MNTIDRPGFPEVQMSGFRGGLLRFVNKPVLRWIRLHALGLAAIPLVATVSFIAMSGSTAPNIPVIALSADPLYAAAAGDKPVLALALSVEFPTVGAQYVETPNTTTDGAYTNYDSSSPDGYLGYYDAESCYTYNKAPTETPVAPLIADDYKRFDRSGPAIALTTPDTTMPTRTSRMCAGETFSGNFLNWASSSAIDMLRLSLTGGDRSVDTPTTTILQRAVLPDGSPRCFWNSTNFPAKQLRRSGGTSGTAFFGAVPESMRTTAAASSNDIWIGNRLNRIYFRNGSSAEGSCTDQSGYSLGGSTTSGAGVGTVTHPYQTPSTALSIFQSGGSNFAECPHTKESGDSSEGDVCSFTGTKEVLYGSPPNSRPDTSKPGGWLTYVASGSVTCGNSMTGSSIDPANGVYKRCYYRDYTAPGSGASTTLSNDQFFYARVQVCNANSSGVLQDSRDYDFCKKYPNGNYKPAGAIQKYSDQLRLAAFGYLMDQVDTRYGAVLRAPIKYVGGKTFDINGVDNTPTSGNPKKEWNESTGVFLPNPDSNTTVPCTASISGCSSTTYLSGVISYLNQFGRTGSIAGRYKIYDPFSELHYETLRYLQGLSPSSASISGITTDMYDGFPVSTTWSDPYGDGRTNTNDYSCLKSNIVMIGDKNTNERSGRLPTASDANNIPDISAWSTVVQNFEKNVTSTYTDGQGVSRTTGNPNGANSSVPSGLSSQVMGSAYWAHTHDIRGASWTGDTAKQRPGLRVKTFIFDVNEFSQSTSDTARRTSNQLFMAAKYGGFETDASNAATNIVPGKSAAETFNTKGNPFYHDNLITANNYVWQDTDPRTARVGEANTYFLQKDARGVLRAFDDIFSRASTAARSIAGGAIQSKNLTQAGNTIFQGTFDTSDWSGDLLAIPVTVSSSNVVAISNSASWTAATRLAALTAPATSRNIVVGKVGATANPVATAFTWADIETVLKDSLDKPSPNATSDGLGQDRLNYLRGDRSKESNPFRKRNRLLGDIINSGVAYSGTPTTSISSSTYATFATNNASRTPAVFVGANDGMLHAFKATSDPTEITNGDELFAYIPSWLGPKLSALTAPSYVNAHQSYVDGTPVVAEAQVGSAGTAADWKTVLVAGTGGGGQGVFALDVTDPTAFSATKVMWEFTNHDDPDMGFVTGRPQILKLRTNAYNATTATYKWFAVVPSGVNNYLTANNSSEFSSGSPALFLIDLSKAAGTSWTLGTNYYKVSLPIDSTVSTTVATGLINFKAAIGNAREVTQIYMGDLHGNLWKLDFSLSAGTTEWNMGKLSSFNKGTSSSPIPYPLFIARDASDKVQPITMAPSIAFGPERDTSYVFFGTGKYYENSDKSSTTQQTEYMIFDNADSSGDASPVGASAISGRARLKQGTANATTGVISTPTFTPGRATTNLNTEAIRSGWYADLPASGERQISSATVFGNQVVFGTVIPGGSGSSSCGASGGGGNQYTIDIATGNGTSVNSSVGLLGEPLVSEITGATAYTPTDSTGRRLKTITSQIFQQGSTGVSIGRTTSLSIAAGRLSWRQINNYQDLKNAP